MTERQTRFAQHEVETVSTSVPDAGPTFRTIKEARAAGYHDKSPQEYGGEEIIVKGHRLFRATKVAITKTQWGRLGFRIKADATRHATVVTNLYGGLRLVHDVFRQDQVEPKRKYTRIPAEPISLAAALRCINRRAKRCRDLASKHYFRMAYGLAGFFAEEKRYWYHLKAQVLQHLFNDGAATVVGCHCFADDKWAELVEYGGYSFHRPCAPVEAVLVETRNEIDAKPKECGEPRLIDAQRTLEEFLKGKPLLEVYEWPQRVRYRDFDMDDRYENYERSREDDVRDYLESEGLELLSPQ